MDPSHPFLTLFRVCACSFFAMTICIYIYTYGVATISRLLQIIGLFLQKSPIKEMIFCEKTYNFKEPTYFSHPIYI